MRITNVNNVTPTYKNINEFAIKQKGVSKEDDAKISEKGKDFQYALEKVRKSPDIREDKVNDIKARIKEGTYHVSTDSLVKKMLGI